MTRPLFTLTRAQGANQAVVDGDIVPDGYRLDIAAEPVLVNGFRKMVRQMAYDVSEMAITTYVTARECGAPFSALPVFLVRGFHHGAIQVRADATVTDAGDLGGRRVGVNRGYTVTTGLWARAVLGSELGLDLDSVTWVRSGDEHVASYQPPANVITAAGADLGQMLLDGELDAVVGAAIDHPNVVPLIPDPVGAATAALRERGFYPINHLIVVKDTVLDEHPDVAVALFDAFAAAKRRYVSALAAGSITTASDKTYARVMAETGADPLPYGVMANRAMLEELIQHACRQRVLSRPVDVDTLFAPASLALAG